MQDCFPPTTRKPALEQDQDESNFPDNTNADRDGLVDFEVIPAEQCCSESPSKSSVQAEIQCHGQCETMGPIGPSASGQVDWSPLAGLTGIRPVVDQCSITRYSTTEWHLRNQSLIECATTSMGQSVKVERESKNKITSTYTKTDKVQTQSTKNLQNRAHLVDTWKQTLERAIQALITETSTMEEQRRRLKQALLVLQLPESIATECLERRCCRPDSELVRDEPEEELIKEIALISEIKRQLNQTLADMDAQQVANRAARQRLEYDWSDKKETYENEAINCNLISSSTTTLFKPGATRLSAQQSTEESWKHFTKITLDECEKCRQQSIAIRSTLNAILMNVSRDLRSQNDVVDQALSRRIERMEEIRQRLENELTACLRRLADTEIQIEKLKLAIQNMDHAMKLAQTRMDNRNQRPRIENCRDVTQNGLVFEIDLIHNGVSDMLAELKKCEEVKSHLIRCRGDLEREIMHKRRTILIDRERCQLIRSHYPSATNLTGY